MRTAILGAALLAAGPARAGCFLALALGLDVSASVDAREYALQRDGVATAMMAPEVQQAMLGQPGAWIALAVYEWSGRWQQRMVVDWIEIRDEATLADAARQVAASRRSYAEFPTAVGYALGYGAGLLERAPRCARQTLDLSGDGVNNEGFGPQLAYSNFPFRGVTVNGLVIEDQDMRVRGFYASEVIRGRGAFVELAHGYEEFEAAMRRKLVREIGVLVVGGADEDG